MYIPKLEVVKKQMRRAQYLLGSSHFKINFMSCLIFLRLQETTQPQRITLEKKFIHLMPFELLLTTLAPIWYILQTDGSHQCYNHPTINYRQLL